MKVVNNARSSALVGVLSVVVGLAPATGISADLDDKVRLATLDTRAAAADNAMQVDIARMNAKLLKDLHLDLGERLRVKLETASEDVEQNLVTQAD